MSLVCKASSIRQWSHNNLHCVKSVRIRSFFGPYFPAYSVSLRIQSECGKTRTRKTPNTNTFHAVFLSDSGTRSRSSHRRCSVKKVLLNFSQISQENSCVGVFFIRESWGNFIRELAQTRLLGAKGTEEHRRIGRFSQWQKHLSRTTVSYWREFDYKKWKIFRTIYGLVILDCRYHCYHDSRDPFIRHINFGSEWQGAIFKSSATLSRFA